jgi:hypothetical protein
MSERKLTLAAKLAELMGEVEALPKNGWNDHFKYHFVQEADVVAALRAGLSKRKIAFLPSVTDVQDTTIVTKSQNGEKTKLITTVRMSFQFVDGESGEVLTREWAGRGEDASDKGLYKAITGGNKYFLLKCFLIPTGDDPEQESKQERSTKAQRRQERTTTTRDGARVDPSTGEVMQAPINGDQQKELIEIAKQAGWTKDALQAFVKANYGVWSKMPAADFDTVKLKLRDGIDTGAPQVDRPVPVVRPSTSAMSAQSDVAANQIPF